MSGAPQSGLFFSQQLTLGTDMEAVKSHPVLRYSADMV